MKNDELATRLIELSPDELNEHVLKRISAESLCALAIMAIKIAMDKIEENY